MPKNRNKIRFRIESESHLSSIADFALSKWALAVITVISISIVILLGSLIVMLTPLHTILPGYLKEDQRSATEENLLRLDSLNNVYEIHQRFIDNYLRLTDIERLPSDSTSLLTDTVTSVMDSLISPGERERKFVARMEEQERFNISVLAPLAADGMTFSEVAENGIFSNASKDAETNEVLLAVESAVLSIADGTILASYYSPGEKGYTVIIQHPRGFVSRYSHLGTPAVSADDVVSVGQIIASSPSPDQRGRRKIYIRMWHNGVPVIPFKYINNAEAIKKQEGIDNRNSFETPRGK